MKIVIDDYEYNYLVEDILKNRKFKKLEDCPHHKTNRLEHSKRVSLNAYKICKKLNLDYVSAARAGLLHDFFTNNYKEEKAGKLMKEHPIIASYNSKKYFKLNQKELNIIESHMFPLNVKVKPKYIESYIVSMIDKIACVYEKIVGYSSELNFKLGEKTIYLFLLMFS